MKKILLLILLLAGNALAEEEPLIEKLYATSADKLVSVNATLLFEEKKTNDEGVQIVTAPRTEAREAELRELGKDHWEVMVHLKESDRSQNPILTCVLFSTEGKTVTLPNRLLNEEARSSVSPATLSCLRDSAILSVSEIAELKPQERAAFIRSREEDAKRLADEVNAALTEGFGAKLFEQERRLGIAQNTSISRQMTVEEIARRLVTLESIWVGE